MLGLDPRTARSLSCPHKLNPMNPMTIAAPRQVERVPKHRPDPRLSNHHATAIARLHFVATGNFELQQLECELSDDTLTLHGRVSSFYLKQLAQEAVRELPGVHRVVNNLEVTYASTNPT
jgi:hypothetical protein